MRVPSALRKAQALFPRRIMKFYVLFDGGKQIGGTFNKFDIIRFIGYDGVFEERPGFLPDGLFALRTTS